MIFALAWIAWEALVSPMIPHSALNRHSDSYSSRNGYANANKLKKEKKNISFLSISSKTSSTAS